MVTNGQTELQKPSYFKIVNRLCVKKFAFQARVSFVFDKNNERKSFQKFCALSTIEMFVC